MPHCSECKAEIVAPLHDPIPGAEQSRGSLLSRALRVKGKEQSNGVELPYLWR